MKRNLFNVFLGVTGMLAISTTANAQIKAPTWDGNRAIEHVDSRFTIATPAAISGVRKMTIANDGSGATGEWGGAVTSAYLNVGVVKAYDTLGFFDPLTNGTGSIPSLTGKFALIFRGGGVEFSKKAKLCQDKGAIGCIIINDVAGDPVGMGGGTNATAVTIPVIMVSNIDGNAMNTQLKNNVPVTISLTPWGFGLTHDLGFLPTGMAAPPNYAMPLSQLGTNNGNPVVYKGQTGAYIGNFGTSNEIEVNFRGNINWTPTGGNATVYRKDSAYIPTFVKTDSIMIAMSNQAFDYHATTTGKFDINYTLSMSSTDSSTADNAATSTMYVTDSIFSKGRYDFTKGTPVSSLATAPNVATFIWGPLYHVAQGGYAIKSVQFGLYNSNVTLGAVGPINILVYKWTDDVTDTVFRGIMTNDEVSLVGYGTYTFGASDSSFKFVEANILNASNPSVVLRTESNSTYWVAAEVPTTSPRTLLCVDGDLQYMPRLFVRSRANSVPSTIDLYAPIFEDAQSVLENTSSGAALVRPVFLEAFSSTGKFPDSVRYSVQNRGYTPAIALKLSKNQVSNSVKSNVKQAFQSVNIYPNPATEVLHFDVKLVDRSSKLYVTVADAVGRIAKREVKYNVKDDSFSVDISTLAPGQYFLILNADEGTTVQKFTILNK